LAANPVGAHSRPDLRHQRPPAKTFADKEA